AKVRDDFSTDISLETFYAHPTLAHLAEHIEAGGITAPQKHYPPLLPAPHGNHIPVSFPQESIIFLDQLTPDALAYNSQACIYFKGKIKISLLEKALDHLISRHESLRTTFHIRNGVPTQRIHEPWHMRIPLIDLSNTPQDQRAARTAEIIDREVRHHFDIEKLPLLRWTLLRLTDDDFIVIHVEHHLPHDGWSFAVFMNEFKQTYTDLYHDRVPQLPIMPIQFADYTLWQRKYLQGAALRSLLDYWKKSLQGASSELQLPTDFPRPAKQSFRGTEVVQELGPRLANSLRSFCRREGVTLYMAMLAAFYILISRYTRQSDLTIGTGVANRNLKETECLIGMIVNTLALRLDIPAHIHFRMLLQKIKELTLSAYNYQDLPFEKLVEELKLDRDLSRNPLFQAMFSFHDSSVPLLNLPEASGRFHYPHNGSSKFDLSVIVIPWAEQRIGLSDTEQNDVITIRWEYSTDLFKHETIQRITGHYRHILEQQVAAPERLAADFELTTEEERRILQIEWNQTLATYDHDLSVQTVFERQASLTPDAIALSYRDVNLNYSELNRHANRLAHYLIARGVKPGIRVAVLMERGIEAVISLLAIIKAGGVYVPLDPGYPDSRLHFLVDDSRAGFIVGHGSVSPKMDACISIALDQEAAQIAACDDTDPIAVDNPERPLYIMYTSGSTGTPKGVEIPHRAVNRLVQNSGVANFGADRIFMLLAPLSFDASTFEIWGPLLNGGRCVIYPERLPEFDVLAHVIRSNGVTTLWLTASLFNKIIDEAPQTLAGVEQVLTGGEALSVDHIRRAQQSLPDTEFINGYGPTENTTFTCCYRIPRPVKDRLISIPIGRPIGNTTVHVLDNNLQCVPVGVPGELYAGGAGLALGYLNQPHLTAERFISSPFTPGEKLYKTGDLARYLPDGNIEYLGRIDRQVKLRGFRIEPGEIENALRRHKQVDDCAVILREDTPDDKRLVAYLACKGEVREEILREYLKTQLPAYMVPSAFVILRQLPLNANGKVDRTDLPQPVTARCDSDGAAPSNELEREITAIWQEVLGVEQLGIHDNFFATGGHSLLAAKTIARINKAYAMQVPLALLFEHPTIATFAQALEQLQINMMMDADNLEAMLSEVERSDGRGTST
ncbi:MAG: amino acid adenylation domain-containing protein, partial [Gammaproteobacteria bacterium]